MTTLWTIAGFIVGWIVTEFVVAATKTLMPLRFNFGLGFAGALAGYTFAEFFLK